MWNLFWSSLSIARRLHSMRFQSPNISMELRTCWHLKTSFPQTRVEFLCCLRQSEVWEWIWIFLTRGLPGKNLSCASIFRLYILSYTLYIPIYSPVRFFLVYRLPRCFSSSALWLPIRSSLHMLLDGTILYPAGGKHEAQISVAYVPMNSFSVLSFGHMLNKVDFSFW